MTPATENRIFRQKCLVDDLLLAFSAGTIVQEQTKISSIELIEHGIAKQCHKKQSNPLMYSDVRQAPHHVFAVVSMKE